MTTIRSLDPSVDVSQFFATPQQSQTKNRSLWDQLKPGATPYPVAPPSTIHTFAPIRSNISEVARLLVIGSSHYDDQVPKFNPGETQAKILLAMFSTPADVQAPHNTVQFLQPNIDWFDAATDHERLALNQLHRYGHEKAALRLNTLIEDCAEDNENLLPESVESLTNFFLINKPQYPGPGIFCDDKGVLNIQWSIPPKSNPDTNSPGLLILDFISEYEVKFVANIDGVYESETVNTKDIMDTIEPFIERLEW